MIAGDDKNGFGAAGPLWITGLSPPDSSPVAAPSQLPTATPSPTPQHRAWGDDPTPEVRTFRLEKMGTFRSQLTRGSAGRLPPLRSPGCLAAGAVSHAAHGRPHGCMQRICFVTSPSTVHMYRCLSLSETGVKARDGGRRRGRPRRLWGAGCCSRPRIAENVLMQRGFGGRCAGGSGGPRHAARLVNGSEASRRRAVQSRSSRRVYGVYDPIRQNSGRQDADSHFARSKPFSRRGHCDTVHSKERGNGRMRDNAPGGTRCENSYPRQLRRRRWRSRRPHWRAASPSI